VIHSYKSDSAYSPRERSDTVRHTRSSRTMPIKGDITLKVPRPLHERLQVLITTTGFSVTEFVVYVLRDLVSTETAVTEVVTTTERYYAP
jgi:hypothetical protein